MSHLIQALRFIINCKYPAYKNIEVSSIELPLSKTAIDSFVYRKKGESTHGTILAIHGMTPKGNLDTRMDNVCRALAGIGYTVISPLYKDIQELLIKEEIVDDIADTIYAITADKSLSPCGHLSIFSASFSAGMALIAATYPHTRNLVKSICAIGSYSDAESSIKYLLSNKDNDEYGTFIMLNNFLPYSIGYDKDISEALHTAICDNGYCREQPELPDFLNTLPKDKQEIFNRLRTDASFRLHHWRQACSKSNYFSAIIKKLSVIHRISSLSAAVAIIHGAEDRVIPSVESMKLYRRLQQYKIQSRLCITNAISHGDTTMTPGILPELANLLFTFSFFFSHAETDFKANKRMNERLFHLIQTG